MPKRGYRFMVVTLPLTLRSGLASVDVTNDVRTTSLLLSPLGPQDSFPLSERDIRDQWDEKTVRLQREKEQLKGEQEGLLQAALRPRKQEDEELSEEWRKNGDRTVITAAQGLQ